MLKYPGSKASYAKWITSFFPSHKMYLEPYFGSGSVFFTKEAATYETINDVDKNVVNFFQACRDYPDQLATAVNLTPFARDEFRAVQEDSAGEELHLTGECVEDARRFMIRCCQGFGSKMADRVGWKNTKHSSGPVNPIVWGKLPEFILRAAARLKNAQIENTDAIALIKACNASDCLIYADPPYLGGLRNNKRIYRHEMMSEEQHSELLEALSNHKGFVVLSGYDNEFYNQRLPGWYKAQKTGRANSAALRIETIWMNFEPQMRFDFMEV